MKAAIPYYRVSTKKQERSGLGLEAQQKAVHDFARYRNYKIAGEFTEVESGKVNDRPVLKEALKACKKQNAILLIAKLDRLGRNVAFIATLMESKVGFLAVDSPNDKEFELHLKACFAQKEARDISARTKAALEGGKTAWRGLRQVHAGNLVKAQQATGG
jgi:DNA invertase Pin-like site-specific DNA recombinase